MLDLLWKIRVLLSRHDKFRLLGVVVLMAFSALMELAGIGVLVPLAAVFLQPELMQKYPLLERIGSCFADRQSFLYAGIAATAALFVLKNLFAYLIVKLQSDFVYGIQRDLIVRLYRNYLYCPYLQTASRTTAELNNNLERIIRICNNSLLPGMLVLTDLLVIVLLTGVLCWFMPFLTLGGIGIMALTGGFVYAILHHRNHHSGTLSAKRESLAAESRLAGLNNLKYLKTSDSVTFFVQQYYKIIAQRFQIDAGMYRIGQLPRLMLETSAMLVALAFFAIMLYWGYSEARIQINFVMLVVVMARALPSLGRMHYNLTQIRQTLPLLESIYPDLLLNPPQPDPSVAPLPLDQSLELQKISFRYPNGKEIFKDYSCSIRACESVAVIGKTGRGKTTIADLLLGLLQPDSGQILADGVDIAAAPDRWRKSIGYVPQHIVLLNSSIRENVAFGIPPESIDDAKVLRALQRAQLLDFVNTLPEGLDFFVGDNGNRLSGGQRQRLGIARALYGEPRLLVLDEATSALDADTESAVVAALDELRGSLTMLVIAHRLSTIEQCDRILDLDSVL